MFVVLSLFLVGFLSSVSFAGISPKPASNSSSIFSNFSFYNNSTSISNQTFLVYNKTFADANLTSNKTISVYETVYLKQSPISSNTSLVASILILIAIAIFGLRYLKISVILLVISVVILALLNLSTVLLAYSTALMFLILAVIIYSKEPDNNKNEAKDSKKENKPNIISVPHRDIKKDKFILENNDTDLPTENDEDDKPEDENSV